MTATSLSGLGLAEAAHDIAAGTVASADLVRDCLARIDAHDGPIRAWRHLDPESALDQARRRDEDRARGAPTGPLHGVPIGVKDIIDTAYMPTERGSPIFKGRMTRTDAAVVARLRDAGAVILGKTVTTEFAWGHPNETTNPHDPARTPGGSSSGSAAAVAAYMVPGALGTQTQGSVIRPASFCGVVGFKPTFGLIPRTGILELSKSLDTVGVFARSVEDAALLAEVLIGRDAGDPATALVGATPALSSIAAQEPPLPPRLAFAETPVWDAAEPTTREAFSELCEALGERLFDAPLPADCAYALDQHITVMYAEIAQSLRLIHQRAGDLFSDSARAGVEKGHAFSATDYLRALAFKDALSEAVETVFDEVDAVITPAAPGEAPLDHTAGTGDPAFCTLWQFCGLPAVTLPLLQGPNGLPMGVQVVGKRGDDARLLRTARWLAASLQE
jgi:Asp-tRNA(Asn)/Glu-tRNA(Gln) amidotransferase A subunit family amidase